jgi:hypothetical protein
VAAHLSMMKLSPEKAGEAYQTDATSALAASEASKTPVSGTQSAEPQRPDFPAHSGVEDHGSSTLQWANPIATETASSSGKGAHTARRWYCVRDPNIPFSILLGL